MEENKIDIEVKLEQKEALNKFLADSVHQQENTIKHLKHIIITLIICFSSIICFGFGAFVWYESQFETETTKTTEVYTDGDNANAEYNNVEGNQYNDSATHNE